MQASAGNLLKVQRNLAAREIRCNRQCNKLEIPCGSYGKSIKQSLVCLVAQLVVEQRTHELA